MNRNARPEWIGIGVRNHPESVSGMAQNTHLLKHNLVDLVIMNKATPLLAYQVIHNGLLLFSRSEDLRIKFEINSLKRHADTKRLREIKSIYSRKRAEKGISAYD